jgi:NAD(P)-dependent dehydrogenase (short-subunit alcohol dehydrogenase family)
MFDLTGQLAVVTGARRGIGLAFAEALGELGRPVDILVNEAGTIERAPAAEHPDAAWDRVRSTSTLPSCSRGRSGRGWFGANGFERRGDPAAIELHDRDQVVVQIGGFVPPHPSFTFVPSRI